jgi:hypothetical protein
MSAASVGTIAVDRVPNGVDKEPAKERLFQDFGNISSVRALGQPARHPLDQKHDRNGGLGQKPIAFPLYQVVEHSLIKHETTRPLAHGNGGKQRNLITEPNRETFELKGETEGIRQDPVPGGNKDSP